MSLSPYLKKHHLILLVLVFTGLVMRLIAARGDVWLDEIWTLRSLRNLSAPHQIFTEWLSDNNHHLNSLYLYLVQGLDSSLVLRAFSIMLGTISIIAGYWAGKPYGRVAATIFSGLIACLYPMVHAGSEARGYAGLILCTIIAIGLIERHLRAEDSKRYRFAFALCIAIGMLFHLTVLIAAIFLGLWVCWERLTRTGWNFSSVLEQVYGFFMPAAIAPLLLMIGLSLYPYLQPGAGIEVGGVIPFEWSHFEIGYGRLLRLLMGMPPDWPSLLAALVTIAILIVSMQVLSADSRHLLSLGVIAILLVPLSMGLAGLPNLNFPRYFTTSGLVLMLVSSVLVGQIIQSGGIGRLSVLGAGMAVALGQVGHYASFFEFKRGDYRGAIADMTASQSLTYDVADGRRTVETIHYFQTVDDASQKLQYVSLSPDTCDHPPYWRIVEVRGQTFATPDKLSVAIEECVIFYRLHNTYYRYGLSGLSWALYRHTSAPDSAP